jgi:hypothetical protein
MSESDCIKSSKDSEGAHHRFLENLLLEHNVLRDLSVFYRLVLMPTQNSYNIR